MSSIAPSFSFDTFQQWLEAVVKEAAKDAVKAALQQGQPRYPERVSVSQASEITRYSVNSLYQMHSKGQVPGAIKIGGKLLFETAALQEWVSSGATPIKG